MRLDGRDMWGKTVTHYLCAVLGWRDICDRGAVLS